MFFPEDTWNIIKLFLLYNRAKATNLINYQATLPYILSMHQYKGVNENFKFLQLRYSWVFNTLSVKDIKYIITKSEEKTRKYYN